MSLIKVVGMKWKCGDVYIFPYKLLHKSVKNAWDVFVNNVLCFKYNTFVLIHMHFIEFRLNLLHLKICQLCKIGYWI